MLTKEQKARVRAVYAADVWHNNEKMTDFCTNKVATLAELPGGDFIPVEKQKIEKDFCFGESGYDYDEAQESAAHARTSESHFKRENMKRFRSSIQDIEEQYDLFAADPSLPRYLLLIAEKQYYEQPDKSPLKGISFFRDGQVLEAMGGSAFIQDIPGAHVTIWNNRYRVPTLAELDAIKAAYEQAAQEHEKKVDAYLKKYGLSKVHAWTYWRDA